MRFTALNPATQQLEQTQAEGSSLFFKVGVFEPFGNAQLNSGKFLLISLDGLCALIAERLAVLEAAEKEPAKQPKPKRKVAA